MIKTCHAISKDPNTSLVMHASFLSLHCRNVSYLNLHKDCFKTILCFITNHLIYHQIEHL